MAAKLKLEQLIVKMFLRISQECWTARYDLLKILSSSYRLFSFKCFCIKQLKWMNAYKFLYNKISIIKPFLFFV